jgi:hypothetical protein
MEPGRHLRLDCFIRAAVLAVALVASGCGQGLGAAEQGSQETEDLRGATSPHTFTIVLPAGFDAARTAIGANGSLVVEHAAKVLGSSGGYSTVVNAARGHTVVGVKAKTGTVASRGDIEILPEAAIHGDLLAGGKVRSVRASVSGTLTQRDAALSPPVQVSWTAPVPGASAGSVRVDHHTARDISPGAYTRLDVERGSTLTLHPGVYFAQSIDVDHDATIEFNGPTVLYVSSHAELDGVFKDDLGQSSLLLAYSGESRLELNGAFAGTLVAPKASLTLRGKHQRGAFFAKDVEVEEGVEVVHAGAVAPPSPCVGATDGTSCVGPGSGRSICAAGACVALSCDKSTTSSGDNRTTTITEDFGTGPVTFARNTVIPPTGEITTTIEVSKGGAAVLRETFTGLDANGAETVEVDFGEGFHGPTNFNLLTTGGLVSGTIDGKAIRPFDPNSASASSVVFADGSPLPQLTADDGLVAQVRALMKANGTSAGQCVAAVVAAARARAATPITPPITEGQRDQTGNLKSCQHCRNSCDDSFYVCEGGATLGCVGTGALFSETIVGFFIGAGCELALEITCGQVQEDCLATCNDPGNGCCPQACGRNGCCDASGIEFCLDPTQGLCCDAKYTACPGTQPSCYDPTQAYCLPSGRACKNGVVSCGTGQDAICCAGTCVNGQCKLGPTFGITIGMTASTTEDLAFCITGFGFTPFGQVTIDMGPIPGNPDPRPGGTLATATADGNGNFLAVRHLTVVPISCKLPANPFEVTLTATDTTTGLNTSDTFPSGFFCDNVTTGSGFGDGCAK